MKLYFFFALILLLSCQEKKRKVQKRKVNEKYIETIFINDSTYEGIAKYYTSSGIIESKINFKDGVKYGGAVNYFSSGGIHDSVNYFHGLENGSYYLFDTTGNLDYVDFFFFGKRVGKREFYKNGRISEYNFISFDGQPLFSSDYDSIGVVQRIGGEIINLNVSPIFSNDELKYAFTLYIINPFGIKIDYSLGLLNNNTKQTKIIANFSAIDKPFVDTVLSVPPSQWAYYVQADYFDRSNNYHKIHAQPIDLGDKAK